GKSRAGPMAVAAVAAVASEAALGVRGEVDDDFGSEGVSADRFSLDFAPGSSDVVTGSIDFVSGLALDFVLGEPLTSICFRSTSSGWGVQAPAEPTSSST